MNKHSNDCNDYNVIKLTGLRKINWIVKRIWYVTIILHWALEPDRYDFDSRVEQWGIYKQKKLYGGVRIFYLDDIKETLQYRVHTFRRMINKNIWDKLEEAEEHIMEITRLLIFPPFKRDELIAATNKIFRRILTSGIMNRRYIVLAVGNPFTRRLLENIEVTEMKIVGTISIPSKNRFERKAYGKITPHYVILVNLLKIYENAQGTWWNEEIDENNIYVDKKDYENIRTWWDSLPHIQQKDISTN